MLEHLLVDFIANIPLVHHNDVLHSVCAISGFVMVADLSNQFEQQFGTLFVIDFEGYNPKKVILEQLRAKPEQDLRQHVPA